MPFTLRKLEAALGDLGSLFDGAPDLEFRLATGGRELERSGLGSPRRPARLSLSLRPPAQTQEEITWFCAEGGG